MKKFFIGLSKGLRVILSVALISTIAFGIYYYLDKAFDNLEKDSSVNFINFPDDTIDVLVLGSSHAQFSFDPSFVYAKKGLYSYVAASACQPLEVSYQMLREVLKHHNPKVVILEVFTATPQHEICYDDSCYILPLHAFTGQEKHNIINYLSEEKAESYRFPLTNNHNEWKTKDSIDFLLPENVLKEEMRNEDGYIYTDGVEYYPYNWWHALTYPEDDEVELVPLAQESLDNIYQTCIENDIKLILYKTGIDGIDQINQSYRHKVWKWANERDIPYIDYVDEGKQRGYYINIHTDSFHAYISGAGIVTTDLIDLMDTMNIEFNHNHDPRLDKMYESFALDDFGLYLRYEFAPKKYLKTLSNGFLGTIYLRNNAHGDDLNDYNYELLRQMGATDINREKNYFAIIHNNELVAISDTRLEETYNNHKIVIDYTGIYIDDVRLDNPNAYLSFVYEGNVDDPEKQAVITVKNIDVFSDFEYGFNDYDWDK